MSVSPPVRSVWSATKPSEAGDLDVFERTTHPFLEGRAVGRERDAAVDEDVQVRPALAEARDRPARGSAGPGHALEEDQEPRGASRTRA